MRDLILIGVCGAFGAIARFGLSRWVQPRVVFDFALGTLAVNVLGCLLFGLLIQAAEVSESLSDSTRNALGIGFLGAFTTFSTFSWDTVRHIQERHWHLAAANVGANVVLGLAAVWCGILIGRALLP